VNECYRDFTPIEKGMAQPVTRSSASVLARTPSAGDQTEPIQTLHPRKTTVVDDLVIIESRLSTVSRLFLNFMISDGGKYDPFRKRPPMTEAETGSENPVIWVTGYV
jgi:hypothetical protein